MQWTVSKRLQRQPDWKSFYWRIYGKGNNFWRQWPNVEAMIIRSDKIDNEVFDAAKNLKIVVRAGAGYDNVDLAAATAHNVCVMNTPGQNSNAVAELALA